MSYRKRIDPQELGPPRRIVFDRQPTAEDVEHHRQRVARRHSVEGPDGVLYHSGTTVHRAAGRSRTPESGPPLGEATGESRVDLGAMPVAVETGGSGLARVGNVSRVPSSDELAYAWCSDFRMLESRYRHILSEHLEVPKKHDARAMAWQEREEEFVARAQRAEAPHQELQVQHEQWFSDFAMAVVFRSCGGVVLRLVVAAVLRCVRAAVRFVVVAGSWSGAWQQFVHTIVHSLRTTEVPNSIPRSPLCTGRPVVRTNVSHVRLLKSLQAHCPPPSPPHSRTDLHTSGVSCQPCTPPRSPLLINTSSA